jgi:hypothetical protein
LLTALEKVFISSHWGCLHLSEKYPALPINVFFFLEKAFHVILAAQGSSQNPEIKSINKREWPQKHRHHIFFPKQIYDLHSRTKHTKNPSRVA